MERKKLLPPKLARKILGMFQSGDNRSSVPDDFLEIFEGMSGEAGRPAAVRWYWRQVLKSIPMFCKNQLYWSVTMLKNYLKLFYRNLVKNKVYSFIVIFGFAVGLACFFLISMWLYHEQNFDKEFTKGDMIYKLDANANFNNKSRQIGTQTNYTGPMLHKDLPEVTRYLRLTQPYRQSVIYSGKDRMYREKNVLLADRSFFEFFDLPMDQGDPRIALADPSSVVISRKAASKYFNNRNPMGKILNINGKPHKVTGVVDIGSIRTHVNFDFLLMMEPFAFQPGNFQNLNLAFFTYVMIPKDFKRVQLEEKMSRLVKGYQAPVIKAVGLEGYDFRIVLKSLPDVYLQSVISPRSTFRSGNPVNNYIMLAVALIILFIVTFNYINLTLARSLIRTGEIGLRKVLGAERSILRRQMMTETAVQTGMAMVIAWMTAGILTPFFSKLTGKDLHFFQSGFPVIKYLLLVALLVIFLAGIFPAAFLSKISPIQLFRNRFFRGPSRIGYRQAMVLVQFVLSIVLIIATIGIFKQVRFMKNKDLGFSPQNRLVLNLENSEYADKPQLIKNSLLSVPGVNGISISSSVPGKFAGQNPFKIQQKNAIQFLWMYFADESFVETFGIKLLEGRNFSRDIQTDRNGSALINQEAAKKFGLKDPLGHVIVDQSDNSTYRIIGILKDFHNESLHGELKPIIVRSVFRDKKRDYSKAQYLTLKVSQTDKSGVLAAIQQKYRELNPNQLFEYFFVDRLYDSFYRDDARFNRIFLYASGLAILLSCMGLFGLSLFIIQRKIREVSIRKVLGASTTGIVTSLSREFLKWVFIANIFAWPLAYLGLKQWLNNYPYRTSMDIWIFFVSGFLAVVIALGTVFSQSLSAARSNPVDTLKCE